MIASALLISITLILITETKSQHFFRNDTFIVQCNNSNPDYLCRGEMVTDCMEHDKHCLIDCTLGDNICADSQFVCNPKKDCTLLCDSTNATHSCKGLILNATQAKNINIDVICVNVEACQFLVIDTNTSTNINLTIHISRDITNPYSDLTSQYTANRMQVYLPRSGNVDISCNGHSTCHTMQIYGDTSHDTKVQLNINGKHAFKNSYFSFPSDSHIRVNCGRHLYEGACYEAIFDGANTAMNSEIIIECIGTAACHDALIIGHRLSKSVMIHGNNGDDVLSKAQVYCPSSLQNAAIDNRHNCNIQVNGNGVNMLQDLTIHSMDGLHDVYIQCNYTTSIESNCYTNNETSPLLVCDNEGDDGVHFGNATCRLIMDDVDKQWKCTKHGSSVCQIPVIDDTQLLLPDNDIRNENKQPEEEGTHHMTGVVIVASILLASVGVCIALTFAKKDQLEQWYVNGGGIAAEIQREHSQHSRNTVHVSGKEKTKYASLTEFEEDTELIIDDSNDDEVINEEYEDQ